MKRILRTERRRLRRDEDGAPAPQTSQAPSAAAQGAVPAPRPQMHSPSQVLLEVPHPLSDDQPSDTERLAGQIIVAMDEVQALAGQVCDMVEDEQDDAVARRLSLEVVRGLDLFWDRRKEVFDLIAPVRDQAQEQLAALRAEHPGTTASDWLPLVLPRLPGGGAPTACCPAGFCAHRPGPEPPPADGLRPV